MTSSGASYLCLPATNPNRIQPESNRNPLAQLQHQLLDIIHMHTRLGRGSTQKKSFLPGTAASAPRPPPALAPAPAWGGLLLRLLSAVLPANLAGSGTRHQAQGTRALQLQHVRTQRPKLKLFQTNSVSRGQGEHGSMGGEQFGCDLMQQKADKVISGTRKP